MKAVLFVGHGSRDPEGNEQVRAFVAEIKEQMDPSLLIETCYLEFAEPTVANGISTCVAKGARQVVVIPIMLLQAGHSKIHIPIEIDRAKENYPHVQFTYGRPIGIHHEVLEICKNRLEEIGEDVSNPPENTAVLLLGRGGSDHDANSDLYKIARLLWEQMKYPLVEPSFMGVTSPLTHEGVERLVRLGAKKIIIVPYFLFTGVLIKRLEMMIRTFRTSYPEIEFQLVEYFGFHEKLKVILLDRVNEALNEEVKMNCDTCQYRLEAMTHISHHHHHHDHDHSHVHHSEHDHRHSHDHSHDHHHGHGHEHEHNHENHHHGHEHNHAHYKRHGNDQGYDN